jgi:hypothetical protein
MSFYVHIQVRAFDTFDRSNQCFHNTLTLALILNPEVSKHLVL